MTLLEYLRYTYVERKVNTIFVANIFVDNTLVRKDRSVVPRTVDDYLMLVCNNVSLDFTLK